MTGKGIVIGLDGGFAKVRVAGAAECMKCPSKSHCHGEIRPREITVINDYGADIDDGVEFEAEPWKMLLSSTLIWLLPVISMIIGYLIADRFAEGAVPIIAAFVFLGLSFFVLRIIDRAVTGGQTFYPRIIRKVPLSEACIITQEPCDGEDQTH